MHLCFPNLANFSEFLFPSLSLPPHHHLVPSNFPYYPLQSALSLKPRSVFLNLDPYLMPSSKLAGSLPPPSTCTCSNHIQQHLKGKQMWPFLLSRMHFNTTCTVSFSGQRKDPLMMESGPLQPVTRI